MATSSHFKKPSTSSLPDAASFSPDPNESRIPRPTSTSGKTRRREPLSMAEALQRAEAAANRHRAIEGSPSPAPRFSRMGSSSSDFKPLYNLFSQKPIDLGRLGSNANRRGGTLSSNSFGSTGRKDENSDDELDRKMKQFEEDERIVKAMRDDKTGPFVRRRATSSGTGSTTPVSARKAGAIRPGPASFGNDIFATSNHGESRSTWGEKAQYDPNWLRQFQNHPDAAVAFHERVSGSRSGSGEHGTTDTPARPATVGPSSQTEPFKWQVDDEFTAGDLQVSTSPPVSFGFGRGNNKLDELRRLEIDVERKYPIPSDLFAKRSNTRLDEIARLEKEAALKYPVTNIEDSGPVPMVNAQPARNVQASFYAPQMPSPTLGSPQAATSLSNTESAAKIPEQAVAQPSPSAEIQLKTVPEPSNQTSPPSDQQGKDALPTTSGTGSSEEQKASNPPVEVFSGIGADQHHKNARQQYGLVDGARTESLEQAPAKDDTQDLLREFARASNRNPSTSPVQDKASGKPKEGQKAALVPTRNDKVDPIAKSIRSKNANKAGSPSKPRVGFTGISRSSSTNSLSSNRSSVASYDPTARLEAEADLFALDNQSERGSFRVPSPLSDSESEAEDNKADDTPRPDRFGPAPMPTPQVTGAYVDTPVTVKVERRDMIEDTNVPQPNLLRPQKAFIENRDPSTSPKASKSESQAGRMRRRELRETRRSKSAPHHRSPLKNSAKLPSVKDDLRQICQKNEIDDSTLDDLTDLVMASSNPEELVDLLKKEEPKREDVLAELPPDQQLKTLDRFLASVRTVKKGIENLEDRVAHSEKQARPAVKSPKKRHQHSHPAHDPSCLECATSGPREVYTYMHVPIPRLYKTKPRFKLTFAGILLLLLCMWRMYWFAEDLFYERWGKQEFCYRGTPCRWDVDDPEYGFVIPVKLDEWVTGGVIRPHAARWLEEAQDSWADFEDWWRGVDIQQVDHRIIRNSAKKAQYWRRIEKKGLFPKWNPASWTLPQIEAWEREAAAQEEAEARAVMGYDIIEEVGEESMNKDQPIRSDSADEAIGRWW